MLRGGEQGLPGLLKEFTYFDVILIMMNVGGIVIMQLQIFELCYN